MKTLDFASKRFDWVNQYRDRSVTEIEMRMILNHHYNPEEEKAAWFYLRDKYYCESVPKSERINFISEGKDEYRKLSVLKNDMRKSEYPTQVYNRPSHLEELVFADLERYVNENFPVGELNDFERER